MGLIDSKMTELWQFSFGQFEISLIGQFGRKPDFQEFLSDRTKIAIARSFLDQLAPIFLQMEAKTYIYVVQVHFGDKLFIFVPNLKREVKHFRF